MPLFAAIAVGIGALVYAASPVHAECSVKAVVPGLSADSALPGAPSSQPAGSCPKPSQTPSVTPTGTPTATATPTKTAQATSSPSPSPSSPSTATPTSSVTQATATTVGPTNSPTPSPTSTSTTVGSTNTPVPPTNTPVTQVPTNTPTPPSATPTATATPTPSATPVCGQMADWTQTDQKPANFTEFSKSFGPHWDACDGQPVPFNVNGSSTKPVAAIEICVNSDIQTGECLGVVNYPTGTTNVVYQKSWIAKKRTNQHSATITIVFSDGTVVEHPFFLPAFPAPGAAMVAALFEQLFGAQEEKQSEAVASSVPIVTGSLTLAIASIGAMQLGVRRKRRKKE